MPELIYHEVGEDGGVSIFDEKIKEVIENADARLVSPYVGKGYLEELTELADSWRLVTDFDEMASLSGWVTDEDVRTFLTEHSESIRHLNYLHAKAAITDDSAILGSMNLTEKGIFGRTEIGVQFNDVDRVNELNDWFTKLWNRKETETIDAERVASSLEPAETEGRETRTGGSSNGYRQPPVSKRRASVGRDNVVKPDKGGAYEALIERVGQLPNRERASRFFDLFAELTEFTGMSNDDPSLVSSMPDDRDKIAITVNRRYVLVAYPRTGEVGVTLPERDSRLEDFFDYDFGTVSGESEEDSPYFYIFPELPHEILSEYKDEWRDAVVTEQDRAEASTYRDSHEPVVYRVATDLVFRQRVLNDAFD